MNDRATSGAAIWLGILAVVGLLIAATGHLGPAVAQLMSQDDGPEADCSEPPRYAEWRAAFRSFDGGRQERTRREAAAHLTRCRSLHGASKATVQARLGKALPGEGSKAERRRYLEYHLGPDGLGIDEETLYLHFDSRGRLFDLSVEQG
jgi:hypothetical protein